MLPEEKAKVMEVGDYWLRVWVPKSGLAKL